jgi:hypothetical protein
MRTTPNVSKARMGRNARGMVAVSGDGEDGENALRSGLDLRHSGWGMEFARWHLEGRRREAEWGRFRRHGLALLMEARSPASTHRGLGIAAARP